MRAEDFVSRLDKPRQISRGRWVACCPAHADKTPSLSIAEGDDGRTLLHCFAGCALDEIVGAVGVKLSEIMPADRPMPLRGKRTFSPTQMLEAMEVNATIVALLAADMANGKTLAKAEKDKLFSIAGEFAQALELVRGK